ncbi:carbohydrate sulfotransferase 8-like isoform X1 [Lethenteron reissneri]|uniref:carbohydrate sulfotransferase 8-like isoform X1 n=2 Tax=Lethenteron reissneri TaxID=7753 RepID=UPI002AB645B7|nr:carbohydrate sulfotransferase 8-like isoform X1 [Lethenteron reissneri]
MWREKLEDLEKNPRDHWETHKLQICRRQGRDRTHDLLETRRGSGNMKRTRSFSCIVMLGGLVLFYIYLKYHMLSSQQSLKALSAGNGDVYQTRFRPRKMIPTKSFAQVQRAIILRETCGKLGHKSVQTKHFTKDMLEHIYVVDSHYLLYCGIAHVGDIHWKKIALVLSGHAASADEISSSESQTDNGLKRLSEHSSSEALSRMYNYTSMLFVRDPMERVVSAYREMMEKQISFEKDSFGGTMKRTGQGVTFQEFVQFLLNTTGQQDIDWHWRPYHRVCNPCLVRYTFIGKLETLQSDAAELLSLVNAPKDLTYPSTVTAESFENITQRYLAQLPPEMQEALYKTYYVDYLLFGYPLPPGLLDKLP